MKTTIEQGVTSIRLVDSDADILIRDYLNDPKSDISPIFNATFLVFHKKINQYRNFQWYALNKDDIASEFNLWFYEILKKFKPAMGSILPYLFFNLDFLISDLFYRYTGNHTNLDKNMLTLKYAYNRLLISFPNAGSLSGEALKVKLREFMIGEKVDFYLSSNSKEDSYKLAQKYLKTSGIEAALNYLPEITSNLGFASLEEMSASSNFDLSEQEKIEPTLDLLVKMSLGENLWAVDAFLEYLGIDGDDSLSLNNTALNNGFSKKDLSDTISKSFTRIGNPLVHFAYLSDIVLSSSDSLITFDASQFSDF